MAIGVAIGALILASVAKPLIDIDLYWHILAGQELLAGVPVNRVGGTWSFAPEAQPWVTTQWLAEVALFKLHDLGGWSLLVAYRTVTCAITLALLATSTLRQRPLVLTGFPFLIAAASAVAVSQERPQQATLVGAAALGTLVLPALIDNHLPRWWMVLVPTWVWANYHGGWVLVPATMALIGLGRFMDVGFRDLTGRKAIALSLGSAIAGSLTPAGASSTFAVLRFSDAAQLIQEWLPTTPLEGLGYLITAMAALTAVAWSRTRVPRSIVTVTLCLFAFSLTAVRNVAPAMLLLAPLVAHQLAAAFPDVGRQPEPRWSAPAGIALACAMLFAGLASIPGRDHLPRSTDPVSLASQIRDLPGQQKVLNDYNVAGFVLFFGGPDAQVGIDGRTDRYGSKYIGDYAGLKYLEGNWEQLLNKLSPTSALIDEDTALAYVLIEDKGWTVLGRENGWILLAAP